MQEGQGAQMPSYQQTWSQVGLLEKSISKPQLDQVGSSMAEWTRLRLWKMFSTREISPIPRMEVDTAQARTA